MRATSQALMAALIVAGSSLSCATRAPSAPEVTSAGVRFVLVRPEAGGVSLTGSFNQWSAAAHPMSRTGSSGAWMIVVPLPPGEHLFMYVVDGMWVSPPMAEDYADDGFGARNGVVVVRPNEP